MYESQLHPFVKSYCFLLLIGIFGCVIFFKAFADSTLPDSRVNKKKAGVLYNLSKFIDWPDQAFFSSKSTFKICLIGEVVFLDALKNFEKRQIRGRAVRVIVLPKNLANLSDCQTLYLSSTAKTTFPNILAMLDKKSILTISDLPNFVKQGGMIGLIQVKKRVRFAINLDATKSVNLVISAQLLRLAKSIKYKDGQISNP